MASNTIYPSLHGASTIQRGSKSDTTIGFASKDVISTSLPKSYVRAGDVNFNGFINAAVHAYSGHHNLRIRPDDIWIAIVTQYGFFLNAHVEEFRNRLVSHEGRQELTGLVLDSAPEDIVWPKFVQKMSSQVQEHILDKELKDWMMPAFSTTIAVDQVAAGVALLSSMQNIFSYTAEMECGLPIVTLLGKKADYKIMLERLEKLRDTSLGSEPSGFADLLEPIIKRLIRSFDEPAAADVIDFWGRIFAANTNGSGAVPWSGWITAFMFWTKNGNIITTGGAGEGLLSDEGYDDKSSLGDNDGPPSEMVDVIKDEEMAKLLKDYEPPTFGGATPRAASGDDILAKTPHKLEIEAGSFHCSALKSKRGNGWSPRKSNALVLDGVVYPTLTNERLPPGFSQVPIKIMYPDRSEIETEMLAGSIGIKNSSSRKPTAEVKKGPGTMQPVMGWLIHKKQERRKVEDDATTY